MNNAGRTGARRQFAPEPRNQIFEYPNLRSRQKTTRQAFHLTGFLEAPVVG